MKSLKIHIEIEALDCYIYGGHVFIVTVSGELIFCSLTKFVKSVIERYPEYGRFLRLAFLRNDFFYNNQGDYFLEIKEIRKAFDLVWKKISKNGHICLKIDDNFEFIDKLNDLPVYDIRAYAMKLYIATRSGLFECDLCPQDDGYNINPSKLKKIFDQKTVCISAKSGTIFASAGHEGLFVGRIDFSDTARIDDRPILSKSLRTSWSSYDIFNYSESNRFSYVVNDVEKVPSQSKFSKHDEKNEKVILSKIASNEFQMDEMLGASRFGEDNILFCFNSGQNGFFYLNDGEFYLTNILKTGDGEHKRFSSRNKKLPLKNKKVQQPLSAQLVQSGCVVEFMNGVSVFQNNVQLEVETEPIITMRTYLTSIRYRNLMSIVKDDYITLHALYPFLDYSSQSLEDDLDGL